MAGILDNLFIIQKFVKILTWTKLGQIAVFIFLVGLAWAAYENRESIYNFANQSKISKSAPVVHSLSKKTTDEIDATVRRSDIIVGMQVNVIDFQRNTRKIIYSSIDLPELADVYSRYTSSIISDISLFNNDVNNNKLLVELINGEFVCIPFNTTILSKLIPEATKYITTVCAQGIPPYYGRFSGILNVYAKRQPTPEEVDSIRALLKNMASTIFERDLR